MIDKIASQANDSGRFNYLKMVTRPSKGAMEYKQRTKDEMRECRQGDRTTYRRRLCLKRRNPSLTIKRTQDLSNILYQKPTWFFPSFRTENGSENPGELVAIVTGLTGLLVDDGLMAGSSAGIGSAAKGSLNWNPPSATEGEVRESDGC